MSRALLVLNSDHQRHKAVGWINGAPFGTRVEFKRPKRSLDQNSMMWACLTDVSQQVEHGGRKYTPDEWKVLFMHALGRETRFLQGLTGNTFVPYGQSSSDLSKDEMSDLIDFIQSWGAESGVQFNSRSDARTEGASEPAGDKAAASVDAPANGGGGGDRIQSPSPATSEIDTRFIHAARQMLAASQMTGTAEDRAKEIGNLKRFWSSNLTAGNHGHLKSLYSSALAIANGKANHAKAIQFYADMLDCTPADLEPQE